MRLVGKTLGIDPAILDATHFPGPGLGIRILGDITAEKGTDIARGAMFAQWRPENS